MSSGSQRRRQGRPAGTTATETERRILDAALTAFTARGYDATGTRDIVAAAGITPPTLYHHCRTKRDLFARKPAPRRAVRVGAVRISPALHLTAIGVVVGRQHSQALKQISLHYPAPFSWIR